jgi:hypothetical protein
MMSRQSQMGTMIKSPALLHAMADFRLSLEQLQRRIRLSHVLKYLLVVLCLLNLVDGLFTIGWVLTHRAVETNPLMDYLLQIHPVFFISVKIALVQLGALVLWFHRFRRLVFVSASLAVVVYLWIVFIHVRMFIPTFLGQTA